MIALCLAVAVSGCGSACNGQPPIERAALVKATPTRNSASAALLEISKALKDGVEAKGSLVVQRLEVLHLLGEGRVVARLLAVEADTPGAPQQLVLALADLAPEPTVIDVLALPVPEVELAPMWRDDVDSDGNVDLLARYRYADDEVTRELLSVFPAVGGSIGTIVLAETSADAETVVELLQACFANQPVNSALIVARRATSIGTGAAGVCVTAASLRNGRWNNAAPSSASAPLPQIQAAKQRLEDYAGRESTLEQVPLVFNRCPPSLLRPLVQLLDARGTARVLSAPEAGEACLLLPENRTEVEP